MHKHILGKLKPDLTFILKTKVSKALKRLKKRKIKNRYDKFKMSFYKKVQSGFIKISKTNKTRYIVLDNSSDTNTAEKIIFQKVIKLLKHEKI